jgi:hypothetical protein
MMGDGCGIGTDVQLRPSQRNAIPTAVPPNGLVFPHPTAHAPAGPVASTASRWSSGVKVGLDCTCQLPPVRRRISLRVPKVAFLVTGEFHEFTDASHPEIEHPELLQRGGPPT